MVVFYRAKRGERGDDREQWPSISMAGAGGFKAFKGGLIEVKRKGVKKGE